MNDEEIIDKKIEIRCGGEVLCDWRELNHFQGNLKSITEEKFTDLKKSLLKHGLPIAFHIWVDQANNKKWVIDGHHRIMAFKALEDDGYYIPFVPCNVIQAKNRQDAARALLVSNSRYAKMDETSISDFMIENELQLPDLEFLDIPELDMSQFNLEDKQANEGNGDADAIPDDLPTKAKLGELYILGDHRLICGDSTDIETIERLMNGEKADMVFTDPPYGIDLDTNGFTETSKKYKPIIGDKEYFDINFILVNNKDIEIWIFGANFFIDKIGLNGTWTVWDKKSDDEIKTNWDGRFGNDFELCWTNLKTKQTLVRKIVPTGYFSRGDETRVHPTQKPVRLIEHYLTKLCKSQGNVLDYFGGSGSTLIACEKINRKCFMSEIDPHYVDVIIERWQKFSGKNAIREDGVLYDEI